MIIGRIKGSVFFLIILSLSGCLLLSPALYAADREAGLRLLADTNWLAGKLSDRNIVIVDVRSPAQYRAGHIVNAINLPVDATFIRHSFGNRVAPPARIRELFRSAGLKNRHWVVLYDNGLLKDAARFYWVLKIYGHKKISVLDGGYSQWLREKRATSRKTFTRRPSGYVPVITHRYLSTRFGTLLATDNPQVTIIDSRSREEYLGLSSKAKRFGHIPRARSIPWNMNLELVDGLYKLKPWNALKALYKNLDRENRIITYCNRGKESAVSFFVLSMLGYKVSVYDGAWLEWGNDRSLPIVKPDGKTQ